MMTVAMATPACSGDDAAGYGVTGADHRGALALRPGGEADLRSVIGNFFVRARPMEA
jgi:hypothetical protein